MNKSIFHISKMDCPSEERIIRMSLDGNLNIKNLDFNIPKRELTVIHTGEPEELLKILVSLKFGAQLDQTSIINDSEIVMADLDLLKESLVLKKLLLINAAMFLVEMCAGIIAESMGLISDSLDMLADSGVYAISLFAVGKSLAIKKKSAMTNGIFQVVLGFGILIETGRRFFVGSEPEPAFMILVSLMALAANVYCLAMLSKHQQGEVHMQASYICSSTDVMANAGVIIAGLAVLMTNSPYPDLIIGLIVTGIVLRGAFTILKLAKL